MQAEPNVTPMIDVLMVLLIIFMFMVPMSQRATYVQLPVEQPGGPGTPIVLEVGPGGRLALNQQALTFGDLGARLRAVYAGRPDKTITVRGDGAARYQDVVTAIDIARGAGVTVVGLDPRKSLGQHH
ncbi:Biopolymer transport protein ExbD/TolR (plasmid) [Gemmatirosa kalamazoonensis]|jgi:biopolymer transport protein ExbD|uniref:Biopolymer transport protein ExbD/TolR n=1 Tax=Gemmatirosa kalamazoonensis TaxID=861299 RepID=W0RQU7_9BACT|nr:biopolymer transporter ExbD [Gemmatirosa kalamazoonensis]AHG92837.1 Biopolymer transport protein ExbD/TolR [Gemmatirosa kalamazoonensis]